MKGKLFTPPAHVRPWRTLNLTIPLGAFPFTVKVAIQTGEEDTARMKGHRYCAEHKQRVSSKSHCPVCGECETVTGYEHDDHVVTLTDAEAQALAPLDYEKALSVEAMIDANAIDPLYIESTYLIWWADDASAKNYALLAGALKSAPDKWLVGKTQLGRTTRAFVVRYSEAEGVVVMHTLKHAARIRLGHMDAIREAVEGIAAHAGIEEAQAQGAAIMLGESLADTFDLAAVEDTFDLTLREAIEAKLAGVEAAPKPKDAAPAGGSDLLEALKASMAEQKAAGAKPAVPKFGKRGVLVDVGTPDEAIERAKRTPKRKKATA